VKAVGLYRYLPIEDPESLLDLELPEPEPSGRDLLVSVRAIAVNPVDTKQRAPKDKVEAAPRVLGWDAAGVVEAVGPDCTLFRPGDRVWYAGDITRTGCNSERHLVDERIVGPMPSSLGFAEAAALPLTTLTAWEALFDRLQLSPDGGDEGKSLLIIAGAGGVGSIATQLAKRLARVRVIATASREASAKWCLGLGADHVVDHKAPLQPQLEELGLPELDSILCCASTDGYFPTMARLIRPQGRICAIVGAQGPLDVGRLMQKSAAFVWELMFTRAMFQTPDMIEQHRILTRVAELVDAGVISTTIGEHLGRIDAGNLRRAHAQLESGHTLGKLVLEGF
jgi:zinc-binding alcohol dehydrogenase family protein